MEIYTAPLSKHSIPSIAYIAKNHATDATLEFGIYIQSIYEIFHGEISSVISALIHDLARWQK